ncbi:MAG TPA: family 43 glycosylhydrolase, partial [Flavisolibacter sp.]|nr:family 43 glycosylhydrolase [Flavisolibacter sp.]
MNEERTALLGEKKELFRNDKGWEGNLVEGVSMIKKGEYYYAFYAGAGCCGSGCDYQTGIARSKTLLGPWEKYDKNPVLTNDNEWKCPGHGTPVEKDGKYYFLYHAYDKETDVYTGREGLLIEFRFTPDGWIEFVKKEENNDVAVTSLTDDFNGKVLANHWQWSVFQPAVYKQKRRRLQLAATPSPSGAYLGTKTTSGTYTATVEVQTKRTNAIAGLGIIGDDKNTVSVILDGNVLKVQQLKDGKDSVYHQQPIDSRKKLYLQVQVTGGRNASFLYSNDGNTFQPLNATPVDGRFLPPWDRSLRIGLISKGEATQKAIFDNFRIINK